MLSETTHTDSGLAAKAQRYKIAVDGAYTSLNTYPTATFTTPLFHCKETESLFQL